MAIDPSKVVVLDNGSYEIKVGTATDDAPRCVEPPIFQSLSQIM
jgi:actin-related protein